MIAPRSMRPSAGLSAKPRAWCRTVAAASAALLLVCPSAWAGWSSKSEKELGREADAFIKGKPEQLQPFFHTLYMEGEWNAVLNLELLALAALEIGRTEVSEKALDLAITRIQAVYGDDPAAQKTRALWLAQSPRDFRGEPYERAMAFFYRGLLYLGADDLAHAQSAFDEAVRQDSLGQAEAYGPSFALGAYLAGWTSACRAAAPESAQAIQSNQIPDSAQTPEPAQPPQPAQAIQATPSPEPAQTPQPPQSPQPAQPAQNLQPTQTPDPKQAPPLWKTAPDRYYKFAPAIFPRHITLFERGIGPRKFSAPDARTVLRFLPHPDVSGVLQITYGQKHPDTLAQGVAADIDWLALTRGGRRILGVADGKVQYKDGADTDPAPFYASLLALGSDSASVARVLDVAGSRTSTQGAGSAALRAGNDDADTRYWGSLPKFIYLEAYAKDVGLVASTFAAGTRKPRPALLSASHQEKCSFTYGREFSALDATQGGVGNPAPWPAEPLEDGRDQVNEAFRKQLHATF